MNAVTFTFCCADCGCHFDAPEVPEFAYGQFVLRTEASDYAAFLDALGDSAFLESYELVKLSHRTTAMNDRQRGDLQQRIFGVICDPAPNGQTLVIGLAPRCPSCGCRKMASWEQKTPVQPWCMPLVEHNRWTAMTQQQKADCVDQAIRMRLENS